MRYQLNIEYINNATWFTKFNSLFCAVYFAEMQSLNNRFNFSGLRIVWIIVDNWWKGSWFIPNIKFILCTNMLTNQCEQSLFIQSLIAQDNEESLLILTVKVIVSSSIQFTEKSIFMYMLASQKQKHHSHIYTEILIDKWLKILYFSKIPHTNYTLNRRKSHPIFLSM